MIEINNIISKQNNITKLPLLDNSSLVMPPTEKAHTTLQYLKNKSIRTNFLISMQLFIAVSVSYYIINFQLKYLSGGIYINMVILGVAEIIGILISGIIYSKVGL